MEKKGLLKSDSYGVKTSGKDKFWRIFTSPMPESPKKQQDKVILEYGLEITNWKIHGNLYEHEKVSAEIFVSLTLTNRLLEWQGEGNQKLGFRHDRMFRIDSRKIYLEVERGNHEASALIRKIQAYQRFYRDKKELFCVLFTFPTEEEVVNMIQQFANENTTNNYWAVVQNEFIASPLEARISNQHTTFTLQD